MSSSTETLGCIPVSLTIGVVTRNVEVHVFENMKAELLLELDVMALFSLLVDPTSMTLLQHIEKTSSESIETVTTNTLQQKCEHLHENESRRPRVLLEKHASIFSRSQTTSEQLLLSNM